ncbi:MAG TPA: hypothetical protein VHX66_12415 [Solirubrobacteraceae bacterium]|jgi:hypothetical protein|nr:hypothetical protein [Solirubrobacteraceae bacterium]
MGPPGATGPTGAAAPDFPAQQLATTAQTAALTYAAENAGSFVGLTPSVLVSIDPTIPTAAQPGSPYLSSVIGNATGDTVTVTAPDGDTFSITDAHSTIVRSCTNAAGQTACVNSTW